MHKLAAVTFTFYASNGTIEGPLVRSQLRHDLDSSDEDFTAEWTNGFLAYGYIRTTRNDTLEIYAPSCSNDKPMISDNYVENFELMTHSDSPKLMASILTIYWRNDQSHLTMKRIDRNTCEVKTINILNEPVSAIYFRKGDCRKANAASMSFECLMAGTKIAWLTFTISDDLNSATVKLQGEYFPYMNMLINQVFVNPAANPPYFLITGRRPNHLHLHDGGGILYYEKNVKFSRGGLLDMDLVDSGISDNFKIQVSKNGTLIVNGNENVLFYNLHEPVLKGHSLVEKEKRHQLKLLVFAWDMFNLGLEQVAMPPEPGRKSSRSSTTVYIILGSISVVVLAAGIILHKNIRNVHSETATINNGKMSFSEPNDGSSSFVSTKAPLTVRDAFIKRKKIETPLLSPQVSNYTLQESLPRETL
jgi:hypothetical protein